MFLNKLQEKMSFFTQFFFLDVPVYVYIIVCKCKYRSIYSFNFIVFIYHHLTPL